MSFGLHISFGRLCRKQRTFDDAYSEASKITWEPSIMIPLVGIWGRNLRFVSFDFTKNKPMIFEWTAT